MEAEKIGWHPPNKLGGATQRQGLRTQLRERSSYVPTIAWIVHNSASNMARLLIEGMRDLGRTDIEHVASREDNLYLRDPVLPPLDDPATNLDVIGEFPDADRFVPALASPDFWERLPKADFIVFTSNPGAMHNAARAVRIIRRRDLFHKLVYLDEDETGRLHPEFRDMFLKARLAFVWRPGLYKRFAVHPHVVNFGFNGVENRYVRYIPRSIDEKRTDVFYRGRAGKRMPHREPFIAALKAKGYGNSAIMPELAPNTDPDDFRLQHVTGNRHNASYYRVLRDSKIAVYLNGFNPVGYQFWENAALMCAQVIQTPHPCKWYHGGSYPTDLTDYEEYDPPFQRGLHFLTFESPEEMIERVDYLLAHEEERKKMALACHQLAMEHYTSKARAAKFLEYLSREP